MGAAGALLPPSGAKCPEMETGPQALVKERVCGCELEQKEGLPPLDSGTRVRKLMRK